MNEPQTDDRLRDGLRSKLKALFDRANAENAAGKPGDAEATCREILALSEKHFGAWHLLGILAWRAGDAQAALGHIERAIALAPHRADCRNSLGFVLQSLKRDREAEAAFEEAARLDPDFFEAHSQLGHIYRTSRRFAAAEASYRRALALQPDHYRAHNSLGAVLGDLRRYEEAGGHFRRAAELRPNYADAHSNLGHALRATGRAAEAEIACRRAIALAPQMAAAHLNLGLALQDLGRLDEALACFRQAGTLDPDYAMATACEGMLQLLRGDLAGAWHKYEARWRIGDLPPRDFSQPQWRGEALDGKTILLHAEQGFGDTIQFLRYLPLVTARAAKIVLEIQKPLLPLVAGFGGIDFVTRGEPLPAFDLHCPLLSLPLAFGTGLDSIPAKIPYLAADPERLAHWRARLGDASGLKVGIAWAGSAVHRADSSRSIPLRELVSLLQTPGARFFSLQVGPRAAELSALTPPVIDLSAELIDFGETAAAIGNLDLVIAADTAVAHLAGALGKPVWTILPFAPDWRWLLDRPDSPWYPTMRLFRQARTNDWPGVTEAVRQALADRIHSQLAPSQPADLRGEYIALVKLANEHHQAKRHAECEPILRRALLIDPTNSSAWHVLALSRFELGGKDEATELMRKAIALSPAFAPYHKDLGIMLHGLRRFAEALDALQQAVRLDPDDAAAQNALGATLSELGRHGDATASYRAALALKPTYAESWLNLAIAQQALLQLDEAADSFRRALGIRTDYPEAHCSAGMLALLRGDFANGFTQFEWRWRLKIMSPRNFSQPAWQGERLDGKTVLLHAEQGYGDTLQCLRFAPEVVASGGRVILELPRPLLKLATSLAGGGEIVPQGRELPKFDVHCAFMSLPRVLGVSLDNLPERRVPYLHADPAAVERWARRLAGTGAGLKVGLVWAGNPAHTADQRRSIAVERLAPLMSISGVRFYSLQIGDRAQDLALLPAGRVIDLAPELTDFAETAAALANLDVLITVDTAVAHLAGSIGRPCWIMLPFSPDWRWLTDRSDSPWYSSLRLFRQQRPGDWDGVLRRVADELAALVASRRPNGPPLDGARLYAEAAALRESGCRAEAEAIARRILQSYPDDAAAANLLGVLREEAGDYKEAADLLARIAELQPQDPEAHYNLGTVLASLNRFAEAIERYQRAITLNPEHAKAHSNLGAALRAIGRLEEAETACRRSLHIDPLSASAHVNLGAVLSNQDRLEKATEHFRRAAELNPKLAAAELNLGLALHGQRRLDEALTHFRRAASLRPDYADARMAEAFALLAIGQELPASFGKLEWRWRLADRTARNLSQPQWRGEPLAGRTILLHAEQGFGDSLMLLRYAPIVAERGGRVILEVPRALSRLAGRIAGRSFAVVPEGSALPPFDLHCPLMSLPHVLGTTLDTIPAAVPYLQPAASAVDRWRQRLGSSPGLKIGIAWAGNPIHRNDRQRSIALERMTSLFDLTGARWFSLQVGARASDLASLPAGQVSDLAPELTDFSETAAAMANLDLIICVDTAAAHLAGALGRPVWILLPFVPDWRWLLDRADSPWYATARLFRQNQRGDWGGVLAEVKVALRERIDAAPQERLPARSAEPPAFDKRYFAAVALIEDGRDAEAEAALSAILAENPQHAASLRRAAWLCHKRADNTEAGKLLARAIECEPQNAEAHYNLGLVLAGLGRQSEAEASYRRGLALNPGSIDGHNNLGVLLESVGRFMEAEASYRCAMELAPLLAHVPNNLGVLLKESGRLSEAIAIHRRAIELDPHLAAANSNLLYTLNYDETQTPQSLHDAHAAWGKAEGARFATDGARFLNNRDPQRRLRVGYVSGDFRHHSVAFFFAPLLDGHDPRNVEIFLYSNDARADAMTARLKARAPHWVPIHHLSDEQAAARIREDRIDILVDLSGHTSRNRLMLFARKPAPIQITWLGYPNTTGLSAIDYRLTDARADPPGEPDRLHIEQLVRLQPSFLCYRAPEQAAPVAPLPARRTGYVTFGSFNNFAKLSPKTIALWARLLGEVPDARLIHKCTQFRDSDTRARALAAFAAAGIAGERLDLQPPLATTADHLAHYARVDIALDPLPYNGTATTCEALWMGVPVVTLRGCRHASRVGASILTTIGLERLVAADDDEYVAIAVALARDLTGLAALRDSLRARMLASQLCDAKGFAGSVEDAFRRMWRDWCTKEAHGEPPQVAVPMSPEPMTAEAIEAQARRLSDAKSFDEAERLLRGLVERAPERGMAWYLLGRARHARGDHDAAIDFMRKAIAQQPALAFAYNDLGTLLQGRGRFDEAEAAYRRAIALHGGFAEAMSNLGALLAERGRLEDAAAWYNSAIAGDAQLAPAHNNLGSALAKLGRTDEAIASHRQAIALKPDFAEAHYNLGVALQDQAHFDEALASYEKAIALKDDFVDARWNRAFALLALGRYAEGWREHEWRWRRKQQPPRSFAQPLWRGEPLAGRSILLHAEQGVGDTLQFIRYVPHVLERGGRVILQVQPAIVRLAAAAFGGRVEVISDLDVTPAFDVHSPLLSLPLAFATTLETVPAAVPYLAADEAAAARWRKSICEVDGLKIGLVWAGNPQHKNDRRRSIALERLAPLFGVAGAHWFSLQVGERCADLAKLPAGQVTDLAGGLTDFAETAAAIARLDLIITTDTAVAHLAGALAKPVWIMLPFVPDWRWLLDRDDTPWYPTARLFRQSAPGGWDGVAQAIRDALDSSLHPEKSG